jgi:hypothetical protein
MTVMAFRPMIAVVARVSTIVPRMVGPPSVGRPSRRIAFVFVQPAPDVTRAPITPRAQRVTTR